MLYSSKSDNAKRKTFRAGLRSQVVQRFPGAFNPLAARLIQTKGFDGAYVSGAALSAGLGLPDIGLTTLTEVADRSREIARMTDLPVLVDADTGFGEPMNAARTVQAMEDAGVAGLHIEDQINPKRCGHLDGKAVVDEAAAVRRLKAATDARRDPDLVIMARTDVRAVDGLDAAVRRAQALVDAGADAIFPEAMESLAEFEAIRSAVSVPLLANMTEFGKGRLWSVQQLQDVGVNVIIWPVSLLRAAMKAAERTLDALNADGQLSGQLDDMQTRGELYELLDYPSYTSFDAGVARYMAPEQ